MMDYYKGGDCDFTLTIKLQIKVLVSVDDLYVLTMHGAASGGLGNLLFTRSYYSFSFLGHNPRPDNTFWD